MINIIHGEALEELKKLESNSIDLIVTDPPYDIKTPKTSSNTKLSNRLNSYHDELVEDALCESYDHKNILDELVRVNKNINMYFWCNKAQLPMYFKYFVDDLNCSFDLIKWVKTNPVPAFNNKYMSDTEYCFYARKGGYCNPQNYKNASTLFHSPINKKDKNLYSHSTIKPIEIIERLILNSSKEGDTVLDCFLGSGTTAVACKMNDRNCIGIELLEKHYKTSVQRINKMLPF